MYHELIQKFPVFDPNWPDTIKLKWFEAFTLLLQAVSHSGNKKKREE